LPGDRLVAKPQFPPRQTQHADFPQCAFLLPSLQTEETTLIGLYHTFIPLDLRLEDLLKESADTCHHPFPGPFGLHQDDKIIAIACDTALLPPLIRGEIKRGQLLIEIVQKDIAQEGRERPTLRNTFVGLLQPALYHHACPKVFSDQPKNAFVFDAPSNLLIKASWFTVSKNFSRACPT
jgi:hypothetical protein